MNHIYKGLINITTYNIIPWILYFSINEIMDLNGSRGNSIILLHITPFFVVGITLPKFSFSTLWKAYIESIVKQPEREWWDC